MDAGGWASDDWCTPLQQPLARLCDFRASRVTGAERPHKRAVSLYETPHPGCGAASPASQFCPNPAHSAREGCFWGQALGISLICAVGSWASGPAENGCDRWRRDIPGKLALRQLAAPRVASARIREPFMIIRRELLDEGDLHFWHLHTECRFIGAI